MAGKIDYPFARFSLIMLLVTEEAKTEITG